jgi:hypothetical protein
VTSLSYTVSFFFYYSKSLIVFSFMDIFELRAFSLVST